MVTFRKCPRAVSSGCGNGFGILHRIITIIIAGFRYLNHGFVDGEEVDYEHFCDAFISIPLKEGSHDIILKYTTPNLKLGALLSGGALFLFLCITWIPVVVRKRGERA